MLPVAIYCYYKNYDDDETFDIVKKVSSLTHAHKIAILGCFIYVRYMMYIFSGMSIREAYEKTIKYNYIKYAGIRATGYFSRLFVGNIEKLNEKDIKTTGFVLDTIEAIFWVALKSKNYEDSIINAIKLGRDADTTAALVGSITGFVYGNIPERWLNKVKRLDYLEKIIDNYEETVKQ
jgi:ADP-ribosylglycohydrolase